MNNNDKIVNNAIEDLNCDKHITRYQICLGEAK
jgi:hypothetical protein